MHRQLYFHLPDIPHTLQFCNDVEKMKVGAQHLHAIVNESGENYAELEKRCDIKAANSVDKDYLLEWWLWRGNLLLFALSLIAFFYLLTLGQVMWSILPLFLMLITFSLGYYYVIHMPDVHWRDCLTAIKHGEILLIIDLPKYHVHSIDRIVHRRHPEAIGAGVRWKL